MARRLSPRSCAPDGDAQEHCPPENGRCLVRGTWPWSELAIRAGLRWFAVARGRSHVYGNDPDKKARAELRAPATVRAFARRALLIARDPTTGRFPFRAELEETVFRAVFRNHRVANDANLHNLVLDLNVAGVSVRVRSYGHRSALQYTLSRICLPTLFRCVSPRTEFCPPRVGLRSEKVERDGQPPIPAPQMYRG